MMDESAMFVLSGSFEGERIATPEEMWEVVLKEVKMRALTSHGQFTVLKDAYARLMLHLRRNELQMLRDAESALFAQVKDARSPNSFEYQWPVVQMGNIKAYRAMMEEIDHAYVCAVLSPMLEKHLANPTAEVHESAAWACPNHLEPCLNDAKSALCEVCGSPKP